MTADGELLRVDAETHPDLFWAIRGGGGNFGVATRFQFRLHEVGTIVGGMLILPATPDVIASFIAEAEAAPEELSTIANVMPAPPMPFVPEEEHGQLVIMAMLVLRGRGREPASAPSRRSARSPTPIADMVRPMPYPEIYPPEEDDYHPIAVGAHDVHGHHRPRRRGDDRRAPRGLDRVRCAWRSSGCSVGRWPACPPTPPPSPTGAAGSW